MVTRNFVGLTKEEFIEKKSKQKHSGAKAQIRKHHKNVTLIRQTLYLPEEINKILWHHRIDTRKSISQIVTEMTLKYIKNKYESRNA